MLPREHARDAHWVRPTLVAEVEYCGLTRDRRLRAASWRGLRSDKAPDQVELLKADNDKYTEVTDSFGFSWITRHGSGDVDLPDLVADLHAVNASLADAGFGPALLCTLVVFHPRPPANEKGRR